MCSRPFDSSKTCTDAPRKSVLIGVVLVAVSKSWVCLLLITPALGLGVAVGVGVLVGVLVGIGVNVGSGVSVGSVVAVGTGVPGNAATASWARANRSIASRNESPTGCCAIRL